ncbi:MAG: DUF882 domain-containing protein [Myxococcales bacterium]
MVGRRLLSHPPSDPPPLRKKQDKPKRARLRILIAGDPSQPMRAITLPPALPLVASLVGGGLLLATVLLACGSWKLSDARSALEHRLRAMVQAADSVALDPAGGQADLTAAFDQDIGRGQGPATRPPRVERGQFVVQSVNNGEEMEVTFNVATGELDADAYRRFRHLMRCLHTGAETPIDPRLVDLLYRIAQRTKQKILLVSGFRAPMFSLATLSYHTRGMAADIRIPGMTALMARDLAESMGVHGLGYYPVSGFIHVDVRDDRTRWIDYGHNRQDGEGTEHGPGGPNTVAESGELAEAQPNP